MHHWIIIGGVQWMQEYWKKYARRVCMCVSNILWINQFPGASNIHTQYEIYAIFIHVTRQRYRENLQANINRIECCRCQWPNKKHIQSKVPSLVIVYSQYSTGTCVWWCYFFVFVYLRLREFAFSHCHWFIGTRNCAHSIAQCIYEFN